MISASVIIIQGKNMLNKIIGLYEIGGLNLLLFKAEDKILNGHNSKDYMQKVLEAADPEEYPRLLKSIWKLHFKEPLNLENPKSFNEKIQWLKLYDSTPLKTKLADKYLVRNWISKQFGEEHLVPLLGVWECFDDINFDKLPNQFVLKCNHGSGWNMIVKEKQKLNIQKAKEQFDHWMSLNFAYNSLELQYKNIPPRIIAEQYLEATQGGIIDYRFYCFHGEPKQIWLDMFSGTANHIRSIFDMDWNKLPFKCKWPDGEEALHTKPYCFNLMRQYASEISKYFLFVRVDFFEVNKRLYFGELTFTPMGGLSEFDPVEWNIKLGEMLHLPENHS